MNAAAVRFCGQAISHAELALIGQCVARYPQLSREELAATVCEWLDWRRASGALKTRECRDLLQALNAQSLLTLPALRTGRPRGKGTAIPHTPQGDPAAVVHGALAALRPIRLKKVEHAAEQRLWRELVGRYHYLGYRTAYGASLRYLIETSQGPQAALGCLQFSSPAWRMKPRDTWIGWNDSRRRQHLPRVINNSRFLLLPWVRVPHLASHVLALALRTVANDWEQQFGLRPWLVETLVDNQRFAGHCYRAANWLDVGLTTGRGRQDREHQRHGAAIKRVLLYPLRPDARQRLLNEAK